MEIKIEFSDKYLKAAANMLMFVAADDDEYEDVINEAIEECSGKTLTLNPSDFDDSEGKKFCIGLAVYAISKVMNDKANDDMRELTEMLGKGLKNM